MSQIAQHLANALAHHQAGRLAEAEQGYRQVLAVDGRSAETHHLLGSLAQQQGRHAEAADWINRAIALSPDVAPYHHNLGIVLESLQRPAEALACYQRALQLVPDYALACFSMGNLLDKSGRLVEAETSYRRALQLEPDHVEAQNNLGLILADLGRTAEAIACFQAALRLRPEYAAAWNNLGNVLRDQGRLREAAEAYRHAAQADPQDPIAYNNLGNVLRSQGRPSEAIACFQQALQLRPGFAAAWNNLANPLKDMGRIEEAIDCYRRALQHEPEFAAAHSNWLLSLQYRPETTLAALTHAHAEFERLHAARLRADWPTHENSRDPARPLRLGFVSADFARHPIGFFLSGVLEHLPPDACQTYCYSSRTSADDMTARLRTSATVWRDVYHLDDSRLAEQIRADRIEVLFDLAGHTGGNRLLAFARKPAPVQITWLGYPGTTGLAAMDYILADEYQVPQGDESAYCERVLRMPRGYACYAPPGDAPPVTSLPALSQSVVTLGCFNNPAKLNSAVVKAWAEILRRLPRARLVLKHRSLADRGSQRRWEAQFAARGVPAGRIEFSGGANHVEFLRGYQAIDLALDPFPYSGGLTTCEALWMGVPVITCPGATFAGRHARSHLSHAGILETIGRDLDDYVERAVALASDLPKLAALRDGLRQRMATSPLCDHRRFSQDLLHLLRQVWRRWCQQGDHS